MRRCGKRLTRTSDECLLINIEKGLNINEHKNVFMMHILVYFYPVSFVKI